MIKLSNCKELNYFDHYEILEYLSNKQLNSLYNKLKNYTTIKLQSIKYNDSYCIIHKSAKKQNTIQLSYFDKFGAYADKELTSYKDALMLIYKSYNVCEVV